MLIYKGNNNKSKLVAFDNQLNRSQGKIMFVFETNFGPFFCFIEMKYIKEKNKQTNKKGERRKIHLL